MKKLILTSTALIAFAAASYAQTTQQVGQQQFARQNQSGNLNVGLIQQVQNNTIANGQNYGNYAITFQGMPNNSSPNFLTITQNDGSQGNRAGISQNGGPNLTAIISQNGGPDGLSGGATSVSATQSGRGEDGNFAGISQIGSSSTATILENNNSRRNSAETYQNGNNLTANVSQSNNSVSNTSFIFQGFTGQNIVGNAINNAFARVNQGRGSTTETNPGTVASEAILSTATITQTASNVIATIDQGGIFVAPGAATTPGNGGRASGVTAQVTQSAIQSTASITQGVQGGEAVGSLARITQTAANQIASISQGQGASGGTNGSDFNSSAIITQSGTGGPSSVGSYAIIQQGTGGGATDNDQALINQTAGVSNARGLIFQGLNNGSFSTNDAARIDQTGNTVTGTIFQNTAGGGGSESNGRGNNAFINQGAGVVGVFQGAFGDGTGSGLALIYQGFASAGGPIQVSRNAATINQTSGAGLRALIIQGRSPGGALQDASGAATPTAALIGPAVAIAGVLTNDNSARVDQLGGDNYNGNIFQTGRFNQANITQQNGSGLGGRALIVQTSNSERAQAIINQTSTGAGNQATILQFAGSNADGRGAFGNQAIINQTAGSNNIAFLQQGQQGAAVLTSSNDNFAQVTQQGSTNQVQFAQIGNNNFVDITQIGNNNKVLAIGGGPVALQQGYNNRLTLVQNSTNSSMGFTYNYTQIGNNNIQEVNQTMP